MKEAMKVVGVIAAVVVGSFATIVIGFHGALVGPLLVQAQQPPHPMGRTYPLAPNQTFTLPDGRNLEMQWGTLTDPPDGFVPYRGNGKTYIECAPNRAGQVRKLLDGNCESGQIVHYWNPSTGEKQDVQVHHGKITPLPTPQSRLELKFGPVTAYATPGETYSYGNTNITVLDLWTKGGFWGADVSNDNTGQVGTVGGQIT